ncbi:hypothetical protein HYT26_03920, partial [Candidatus Pacearchaeota archaeon]|nr:hypothetical protein [Candidatus Pacearchaeota archaeon]
MSNQAKVSVKDKQAKISVWIILAFSVFIAIAFMYFAVGAGIIRVSSLVDGYNFSVREDRGYIYNISVNNTNEGGIDNITQVNITLPSSFTLRNLDLGFDAVNLSYGGNGSRVTNYIFQNTSTVLSFLINISNITVVPSSTSQIFFWFNASASTPGVYNITVTTVNSTGFTNSTNISVTVNDTTIPQVTIVRPEIKNYSATSITFNITVTDNVNISNCSYSLNRGVANYSMSNTSLTSYNATNASIAEGIYNVTFDCNDTSGNWNSTEIRHFGIDTTIPNVTIVSPTNITYTAGNTSIWFNVSIRESTTSCWYSLNSGLFNYSMSSNDTANRGFNASNTSIADGGYVVNFYCNDTADNWNRTSTVTFSKDLTPPLVSVISPLAKNYSATSLEFNVSTNENATCFYSLDGGAVNVTMTR